MRAALILGWVLLCVPAFSVQYTKELIEKVTPVTDQGFFDYLRRLGISAKEVENAKGQHWLSVGEGHSDFTAQAAQRGIDSQAIDALVINKHAPERSRLGTVADLPYKNGEFDRVISVLLIHSFFDPKGFNDPASGNKALSEMIRVTKVGGDIRLNPANEPNLIAAAKKLQSEGVVKMEILPYYQGKFLPSDHGREYRIEPVKDSPPGSIRLTRLR